MIPHNGTLTSIEAAQSMRDVATTHQQRVLAYIRLCGVDGSTSDQAEEALGMTHQNCSARFKALADAGLIDSYGELRKTRSGRRAMVWVAKGEA